MPEAQETCLNDALELSRRLLKLADDGESACVDDGCIVLYGIIRDCAYQIKAGTEKEMVAHARKRLWQRKPCGVSCPARMTGGCAT